MLRSLDLAGDLGERVRAGERAERVYGTADSRAASTRPSGPGWALVGDAGLLMDPITGHGITDAFRDAELVADAMVGSTPAARSPTTKPAATRRRYRCTR